MRLKLCAELQTLKKLADQRSKSLYKTCSLTTVFTSMNKNIPVIYLYFSLLRNQPSHLDIFLAVAYVLSHEGFNIINRKIGKCLLYDSPL